MVVYTQAGCCQHTRSIQYLAGLVMHLKKRMHLSIYMQGRLIYQLQASSILLVAAGEYLNTVWWGIIIKTFNRQSCPSVNNHFLHYAANVQEHAGMLNFSKCVRTGKTFCGFNSFLLQKLPKQHCTVIL